MKKLLPNQPRFKVALLLLDIFVFVIALLVALILAFRHAHIVAEKQTAFFIYTTTSSGVGLIIYLASFYLNNLYKRHIILSRHRQFVLIVKSQLITCAVVLLVTVFFFHRELATFGRLFFALIFTICLILSVIIRIFIIRPLIKTAARKNIAPRNLILVGKDGECSKVIRSFVNDPYNNFHIVGIIDDSQPVGTEIPYGENPNEHIQNQGKLDDLTDIVQRYGVDEVLIAIDGIAYLPLIRMVEKCVQSCPVVRVHTDFLRIIVHKMHVEQYSGIPVIMLSQGGIEHPIWKIKRCIDIVSSSIALIALSPLFAGIAIGIKLSSPGPIFFKQVRIGKDGRPFDFYKFRSMHVASDSKEHKKFVQNFIKKDDGCTNDEIKVFKITKDPRIFKFGFLLRKTSLDEFPQFFNVLKGDMSLVGPRPCLPYEWECYDDWHKNRLNVLPGCTGMWQALGRSSVSFEEMVVLDMYYISNMSMWLDIRIILLTFPVIFLGKGGY